MINKDLGLFVYDSLNRETISTKRIENKHLLICKYLPSSFIIDHFWYFYENKLFMSLVRFHSISWKCLFIKKRCYVLVFVSVVRTSWKDGILLFMSHLEIAVINIDKRFIYVVCSVAKRLKPIQFRWLSSPGAFLLSFLLFYYFYISIPRNVRSIHLSKVPFFS